MGVRIKVCGLTRVEDAEACIEAGVDAIGLNFWPGSKRHVAAARARQIVDAVQGRLKLVGLFVDAPLEDIQRVRAELGLDCVQLHGDEPPELVDALSPGAFKALRVAGAETLKHADAYPCEPLLLDAFVPGQPGGTGASFDWTLATALARRRKVLLAGGLTSDNVADAIAQVRPYGVDTAGGVESAPGIKDAARIRAFVAAVRG